MFSVGTIVLLTATRASMKESWCGVISKACLLAIPSGGIAGFWGCQAGTGAVAVSCEVAGGGPENPAADACAVGLGATFDGACLAAVWGGGVFSASACANAMYCEWHKDEPKRPVPDPPKPIRYEQVCICNPLPDTPGFMNQHGDGQHHCAGSPPCMPPFGNRVCNPAHGHADCFAPQILINGVPLGGPLGRRLEGGETTTTEAATTKALQPEKKAPKPKSKILGGKGKKLRKHPKKDDMICKDDNEAPARPDELREEGDARRRFVVGGRHCYCDDVCTWYEDCCPDCYHAHDVSDPCTDQHGPFGQAHCNDPALCGEPKICAGCAYTSWLDHCSMPQDPCTQQHGAAGWLTCKSRSHCAAPAFCQFCEYDSGTDHCYTPGAVTPSCATHYQCSSSLSGCESYADKDHCLYLKMLSGELTDVGSCGQCMKENYGLIPNRNVLETHHESHEAYCLMWDCGEEFKECFGAFDSKFPSHEKHNGDTTHGAMFACVKGLSATRGDARCNSCLAKYQ